MKNANSPAFPESGMSGLTKREYFAIQILPTIAGIHSEDTEEDHCETAIRYADELLRQLDIEISKP